MGEDRATDDERCRLLESTGGVSIDERRRRFAGSLNAMLSVVDSSKPRRKHGRRRYSDPMPSEKLSERKATWSEIPLSGSLRPANSHW